MKNLPDGQLVEAADIADPQISDHVGTGVRRAVEDTSEFAGGSAARLVGVGPTEGIAFRVSPRTSPKTPKSESKVSVWVGKS